MTWIVPSTFHGHFTLHVWPLLDRVGASLLASELLVCVTRSLVLLFFNGAVRMNRSGVWAHVSGDHRLL